MAEYFNFFEKIYYFLEDEKNSLDLITNLTIKFKFDNNFKNNSVLFYDYVVEDGETPEMISYKFFDDVEKHWVILFLNDIIHPQFDWPLSENNLKDYIEKKYLPFANTSIGQTGINWAKTNVKDYFLLTSIKTSEIEKPNETIQILTEEKYNNTTPFSQESYNLNSGEIVEIKKERKNISFYDYEIEENNKKRNIKILRNEFVPLVFQEFKNSL
jgi:hypothetical protein